MKPTQFARAREFRRSLAIFVLGTLATLLAGGVGAFSIYPVPLSLNATIGGTAHQDITRTALNQVGYPVSGSAIPLEFTPNAIEDVVTADKEVDLHQDHPEFHFDDQSLNFSSDHVAGLKAIVLSLLQRQQTLSPADAKFVREYLGKALHTIQDFYAHSNWVEFNQSINANIGNGSFWVRTNGTAASPNCSPDTTNLKNFRSVITEYALTFPHCSVTVNSVALLVEGAYLQCANAPLFECAHGLVNNGIHKDWPGRNYFDQAKNLAIEHTVEFVKSEILSSPGLNAQSVCVFMTDQPCPVSLQISPTAPTVVVAATVTLSVTDGLGNPIPVTWQSSDASLATVGPAPPATASSGVVTGVATGSPTITVTDPVSGATASVVVTVTGSATTPAMSASANSSTLVSGDPATLTATVTPPTGSPPSAPIPTGTVTFVDQSGAALCAAALTSGAGSCSAAVSGSGSDTVTVKYSGDSNYAPTSVTIVITFVNEMAGESFVSADCGGVATPGNPLTITQNVMDTSSTAIVFPHANWAPPTGTVYGAIISCGAWTQVGSQCTRGSGPQSTTVVTGWVQGGRDVNSTTTTLAGITLNDAHGVSLNGNTGISCPSGTVVLSPSSQSYP